MLSALRLHDFALTAHAALELPAGFTTITGETGAGKSVLIAALSFALGAQADAAMIRPHAERAEVEAEFDLPAGPVADAAAALLDEADIPFDGHLVIRRSLHGGDRLVSRLRLNDRAASLATVRALGDLLADIHGQREQLSLLNPARQLELLDQYAGLTADRDALAEQVRRLRELDSRIAEGGGREQTRRIDRLRYEAGEISAASLRVGEDDDLRAELERLAHAQRLLEDASAAQAGLSADALGDALAAARRIAAIDPSAAPICDAVALAAEQAAEAAREVRAYADGVIVDPARAAEVESRLSAIADLQRRFGDSVAEVIAYGERAAAEADTLEAQAADAERIRALADDLAERTAAASADLSARRREAARQFSGEVAAECESLRLRGAAIQIRFEPLPAAAGQRSIPGRHAPVVVDRAGERAAGESSDAAGLDQTGMDRIEMEVSFNPGSPARPLRRVASGGETARLTLAVKAVLGLRDAVPLLVFDEIDAGLGGRMGGVLGSRLARLAESRQVLCITHLPQVAAAAAHHIVVRKALRDGASDVDVRPLAPEQRALELAEMLGGATDANIASALELLEGAGPLPAAAN